MPPARVFNSFSYSAFAAACLSCCVLAATTTSRERESDCLAGEPVSFPSRDGDPVFLGGDRSKSEGQRGRFNFHIATCRSQQRDAQLCLSCESSKVRKRGMPKVVPQGPIAPLTRESYR